MEVFAFNENAVGYEDLRPEPQLRCFDNVNLEISKSAIAGFAVATAILGSAPNAQAIVNPGDVCPAVGDIQTALNARGFNAGAVDSNFGTQTANAVRSFQSFNGLAADGIVGPATASALGLENASCVGAGSGQEASGTVTASSLTVRTGAGIRFGSVGNLSSGTNVFYDPTSRINSDGFTWVRVTDGIYSGRWVAESFLGSGTGTSGGGGGQETAATATANVTASSLTVRSGAGLGFDSVGSYSSGTAVSFNPGSRTNRDGYTWVQVNSGIYSGRWVAESFLGSAGGGGTSASGAGTVSTSSGSGVAVRSGPGTGFANVGSIADGTRVSYDATSSTSSNGFNWVRVTSGTYTGRFVARDFLR